MRVMNKNKVAGSFEEEAAVNAVLTELEQYVRREQRVACALAKAEVNDPDIDQESFSIVPFPLKTNSQ